MPDIHTPSFLDQMNELYIIIEYIDEFGNETASADGFSTLPEWSPIYLDKGELTFNFPISHF